MTTPAALSALRKPLKSLLAPVLAGEPWRSMLGPGPEADQTVLAACVVSFISRRSMDWDRWRGLDLQRRVTELVNAELLRPEYAVWPFLDTLAASLRRADWAMIDSAMESYREAWQASLRAIGERPVS